MVIIAAFFGNEAAQAIKASVVAKVVEWAESLDFHRFVTDKVNAKLSGCVPCLPRYI